MKQKLFLILISLALFMVACNEEPVGQTPLDGIAPRKVYDVKVTNVPGGAYLTYKLPDDEDLLYVKAIYQLKEGTTWLNTRASLYTDTLKLEGFGTTDERSVKLIAVDRSNNESEPVDVTIMPLTPPIYTIFETLKMSEDFGGIRYTWANETAANICMHVLRKDKAGNYEPLDELYTKRKNGEAQFSGLPALTEDFAIYITDRWDNSSDTLKTTLTPIFEMQIPYTDIKPYNMPSDTPSEHGWLVDYLWDNRLLDGANSGYHTEVFSGPWPHRITFKAMTGKIKTSRIKIWHRDGYFYRHGNVKRFELLGSNAPKVDGSDDGWTSLGIFNSYKPSGLPGTSSTNEDIEYASQGENFRVSPDFEAYQYYRIKFLESWSGSHFVHLMEVQLFGCPDGYVPDYSDKE